MTTIDLPQRLSRKKKILFSLIISAVVFISFLTLSEIVLRKIVGPWKVGSRAAMPTLEPAGNYYKQHPTLGYLPGPGSVKVTLPGDYLFRITHLPNGLRITHPLDTYPAAPKKEVWIFGCSFTEGWTLNDEDTYSWLIQKHVKNYEVINFGVSGYGTLQSLIQFREALEQGRKPALVVLTYASFHDRRNTLTRAWMKTRMNFGASRDLAEVKLPYMRWRAKQKPELLYRRVEYHAVPLARYSALANTLDETYNRILDKTYHSNEVSRALIEDFANLCNANQINLIVAGITSDATTNEMLAYCRSRGMSTVDISVDLDLKENTNLPYDNHLSAIANQQYAQKLESALCARMLDEPFCAGR